MVKDTIDKAIKKKFMAIVVSTALVATTVDITQFAAMAQACVSNAATMLAQSPENGQQTQTGENGQQIQTGENGQEIQTGENGIEDLPPNYVESEHTEHIWGDLEYEIEPTCTKRGIAIRKCKYSGCSQVKEEIVPATNVHTYDENDYIVDSEGMHHQVCLVCNRVSEKVECTPKEAVVENEIKGSCQAAGTYDEVVYCALCKQELSREHKTGKLEEHNWDEGIYETEPDCTHKGIMLKKCLTKGCDETREFIVLATGHKYSTAYTVDVKATCNKVGSKSKHCTNKNCDSKIAVTVIPKTNSHTETYTVVKATTKTNGRYVYTCKVCNKATRQSKIIYYPKTVKLEKNSYTYTGSAIKPTVTVIGADGKAISKNNYTVSYSNNKNVGKAKVTISFRGNYSGKVDRYFSIVPSETVVSTLTNENNGVSISWKRNTSAGGYYIFRLDNDKYKLIKNITSNSVVTYKDTAAKSNGKKYQYKIVAYKNVSGTIYRNGTTKSKFIYRVNPTNVTSVVNTDKCVKVNWTKNDAATGYYVYKSYNGGKFIYAGNIQSNKTVSYVDKKATDNGLKYEYKVVAYKKVGQKIYKNECSTSKFVYRLTQPKITSASSFEKGTASVSWEKNLRASGYEIKYTVDGVSKKVYAIGAAAVGKNLVSLKSKKTYTIVVRAYKVVDKIYYYSEWSKAKTVKIK